MKFVRQPDGSVALRQLRGVLKVVMTAHYTRQHTSQPIRPTALGRALRPNENAAEGGSLVLTPLRLTVSAATKRPRRRQIRLGDDCARGAEPGNLASGLCRDPLRSSPTG